MEVNFTSAALVTYGVFLTHYTSNVFARILGKEYGDLNTPAKNVTAGIVTFLSGVAGVYIVMNVVSSKH